MEIIRTISEMRTAVRKARLEGGTVGLVPTMGYLHKGHLSLISRATQANRLVVVSIFVNPLQFGPEEDFGSYPRDLEGDCALAAQAGADIIFAPAVEEMYPGKTLTQVEVALLGDWLCGRSRPGHFRGVTTVVSKLFNIVQPDKAYFGEKDAQQLAIIKQMVLDLNFPVEIVPVSIVREEDGLAMSSRNVYLSAQARSDALVLNGALQQARRLYGAGERNSAKIRQEMLKMIEDAPGANVDYVEICDRSNLQPIESIDKGALVAVAVRFGKTRLIDNITLTEV